MKILKATFERVLKNVFFIRDKIIYRIDVLNKFSYLLIYKK